MDDLEHHLKNASREDFLRLRESGLNSFLTRKNLKGTLVPFFCFNSIYYYDEITLCSQKYYFRRYPKKT